MIENASPRKRSPAEVAGFAPLVAMVLLALGSVFVKKSGIAGATLSFHRAWVAGALYAVFLGARGRLPSWAALRTSAVGGVAYALNIGFFYTAIRTTTVANATLIIALQPALIMLLAKPLFHETVGRRELVWAAVALAGVALVVYGSSGAPDWSPKGDLLAVGSLLGWTCYFIASKRARATLGALEYQTALLPTAAVVLLPVALIWGKGLSPGPALKWLWVLAVVAAAGTAHLLVNWAHRYVPITRSSLLTLSQPPFSLLLGVLLLHQDPKPLQLVGMAIVLLALAFVILARRPAST